MKIAIMTQPLGHNYGGIMQAWALQQVLKRMGHQVVTIDRQHDDKGVLYHLARLGYRSAQKMLGKRKAPVNLEKHYPYIFQNTYKFIQQNITMSEPLNSTQKLKAHFDREQYDVVIVGSDQTWRPQYSPNIENFFLDFLEDKDIKRIAYASSFGVDSWEFTEEQSIRCSILAKKFDAVSVREDSGVSLCLKYLAVEAEHVVDPTLLLTKEDYEQLIGYECLKRESSKVYAYILDKSHEKFIFTQELADRLGCEIHSCQSNYSFEDDRSDVDDYLMPSIKDWLAGFYNAKFVVTDSFHGAVFSIIFGKPFFVLLNQSRGTARFLSLLDQYGLSGNAVYDAGSVTSLSERLKSLEGTFVADKTFSPISDNSLEFIKNSLS